MRYCGDFVKDDRDLALLLKTLSERETKQGVLVRHSPEVHGSQFIITDEDIIMSEETQQFANRMGIFGHDELN